MPMLNIADIIVTDDRRPIDKKTVNTIAKSIQELKLQTPISVRRERGKGYVLVAGAHRLAACKQLGLEQIEAVVMRESVLDCQRWEIAENLHRLDLTVQERADYAAKYLKLTKEKLESEKTEIMAGKPAINPRGRPAEARKKAAEELGISPKTLDDYRRIHTIKDEAKEEADRLGITKHDDRLKIAQGKTLDEQLEIARSIAARQNNPLLGAWKRSGNQLRLDFVRAVADRLREMLAQIDAEAKTLESEPEPELEAKLKKPEVKKPESKAKKSEPKPKAKAKKLEAKKPEPKPKAKAKKPEAKKPEPKAKKPEPEPKAKAKKPEPKAKKPEAKSEPKAKKPEAKSEPKAKKPEVKAESAEDSAERMKAEFAADDMDIKTRVVPDDDDCDEQSGIPKSLIRKSA